MSLAPVLETERLVLRPYRQADFDAVAAMWRVPEVFGHIGDGEPLTDEAVWAKLLRSNGFWTLVGHGYWAVETKQTGRLIGEVGFGDKRRTDERLAGLPEAGWAFAHDAQGKGYAREAVTAALKWADEAMPHRNTLAVIAPDNLASIRLAEKCGYQEFLRIPSNGRPRIMFIRPGSTASDTS